MPFYTVSFSAVAEVSIEADTPEEARELALKADLEWDSVELESVEEE
jgi:hypothetical protein